MRAVAVGFVVLFAFFLPGFIGWLIYPHAEGVMAPYIAAFGVACLWITGSIAEDMYENYLYHKSNRDFLKKREGR